ncbi:hypothetical protein ACWCQS_04630 [Streptomyces sp. NPDC002076]
MTSALSGSPADGPLHLDVVGRWRGRRHGADAAGTAVTVAAVACAAAVALFFVSRRPGAVAPVCALFLAMIVLRRPRTRLTGPLAGAWLRPRLVAAPV